MELGKKIEHYRKQKQMTQEALANMVNVRFVPGMV